MGVYSVHGSIERDILTSILIHSSQGIMESNKDINVLDVLYDSVKKNHPYLTKHHLYFVLTKQVSHFAINVLCCPNRADPYPCILRVRATQNAVHYLRVYLFKKYLKDHPNLLMIPGMDKTRYMYEVTNREYPFLNVVWWG